MAGFIKGIFQTAQSAASVACVGAFTGKTMKTINFTRAKLQALKQAYNTAKRLNNEEFEFEGHPLLVTYDKYLIEYLETQFGTKREMTPAEYDRCFAQGDSCDKL